jgi:hypothetical protein
MNKSNSILLINPVFDPATAPNCDLLVKVGFDSFSYAIVNRETKEVSAVYDEQECESGAKKLTERLKTDTYLTLSYREVKVAVYTENKIDIPDAFYNPDELDAYTQYFATPHTSNIYATGQVHFGLTTIFAVSKALDEAFNNFKGKKYALSAGLLSLAEHMNETSLILDFTVGTFNAVYIKDKAIIFQHGYEIENAEEFNYFLLLLLDQLKINGNTNVRLTGIVHESDEIYSCLQKYFENIEFLEAQNELNSAILDDMPAHYYSSLLALDKCE